VRPPKAEGGCRQDRFGNAIGIIADVIVPEAQDLPAKTFKKDSAPLVIRRGPRSLPFRKGKRGGFAPPASTVAPLRHFATICPAHANESVAFDGDSIIGAPPDGRALTRVAGHPYGRAHAAMDGLWRP
jgi:hypothetical protein